MVKPGPGSLQGQGGPRLCSLSAASRPRSSHADFSCASLHRAAAPAALLRTVDVDEERLSAVMSGFSLLHLVSRSQPGALRPHGHPSGLWPCLECCCCVSMTSAAFSFRLVC